MIVRISALIQKSALAISLISLLGCVASSDLDATARGSFAVLDAGWQKDLVYYVAPRYPYDDRAHWRQGRGILHVTIDFSTGSVVQVTVKKSTGYSTLDNAAIAAWRQCRFKPGTWRAVDVPVTFVMAKSHDDYLRKLHAYREQQGTL